MNLQIVLDDRLVQGKDTQALSEEVHKALIISRYANEELSLGEVRELLGFQYAEEAVKWLHNRGIDTARRLQDTHIAQAQHSGFQKFMATRRNHPSL